MTLRQTIEALDGRGLAPQRAGRWWTAVCPTCPDNYRPERALMIAQTTDGEARLSCRRGCRPERIAAALTDGGRDPMPTGDTSTANATRDATGSPVTHGRGERPATVRRLLRPREAAEVLQVSPGTLFNWTKAGRVPVVKIGRSVRYDPDDLDAHTRTGQVAS